MKVQYLPDLDRISALASTTLFAYALGRFVDLPARTLELQVFGIFWEIVLSAKTLVAVFVAGLTATGADWLIRQHPNIQNKNTLQHWVLPGLTALVLGETLNSLPSGPLWGIVFVIGAALLLLVLVAEYIVVEASDASYPLSVAGLTALSFTLFLVLAVTLKNNQTRLSFLAPLLALAAGLISVRYIYLRLKLLNNFSRANVRTAIFASGVLALLTGQLATALHYWSLTPIEFGLAILGPAYGLTNFIGNLTDGRDLRRAALEPAVLWAGFWLVAFLAS